MQDNFLCPVSDAVLTVHPFHLVGGFQFFRHALLLCHISADARHAFFAGLVNLCEMFIEFPVDQQVCVEDGTMLFQKAVAHMAILADRRTEVWQVVLTVCQILFFNR